MRDQKARHNSGTSLSHRTERYAFRDIATDFRSERERSIGTSGSTLSLGSISVRRYIVGLRETRRSDSLSNFPFLKPVFDNIENPDIAKRPAVNLILPRTAKIAASKFKGSHYELMIRLEDVVATMPQDTLYARFGAAGIFTNMHKPGPKAVGLRFEDQTNTGLEIEAKKVLRFGFDSNLPVEVPHIALDVFRDLEEAQRRVTEINHNAPEGIVVELSQPMVELVEPITQLQ